MDTELQQLIELTKSLEQISKAVTNHNTFWGMPLEVARFVVPTIVSLGTFIFGFVIKGFIDKWSKKSELQLFKETITEWIELISEPIKKQSNFCIDFSKKLKKQEKFEHIMFSMTPHLVNKLQEIKLIDYFKTFILNTTKFNSKNLFEIVKNIEYFYKIEKELPMYYNNYHDDIQDIINRWNPNKDNFFRFTYSYIDQNKFNLSHSDIEYIIKYDKIFSIWNKIPDFESFSINKFETELLKPLFEIVINQTIEYPDNEYAYKFKYHILELLKDIEKWKKIKNHHSDFFKKIGDEMEITNRELSLLNKIMKRSILKCFIGIGV